MLVSDIRALGTLVRARRQELGLTQAQLATRAGTSLRLLSELEGGKRPGVTFKTLLRVLTLLGLDMHLTPRHARGGAGV